MADIDISCPKCGTVHTVSEFVDPESVVCRNCNQKLLKPASAGKPKEIPTVHKPDLQQPKPQVDQVQHSQHASHNKPEPLGTVKTSTKLQKEPEKFKISSHMLSWIIFIVGGSIMGMVRYGDILSAEVLKSFNEVSPFIFLIVHVFVCLSISKESVLQGVISLLVPPFMLYNLFVQSDRFFMRAFVGVLAIGMGEATLIFWSEMIGRIFTSFEDWIHNPYNSQ